MSFILNIDTATDIAYISISKEGEILGDISNANQKDHGSFLQPAIEALLQKTSITLTQLDAVAVAAGPGSYTGLRVGMASAKGLCYALNKPLITISTLEILSFAAITIAEATATNALFCPMIDARRMEVFTAIYDENLRIIKEPSAMVLDENSFANGLLNNTIIFFGNGSTKWKNICTHPNALFLPDLNNSLAMSKLAYTKFCNSDFADLAYVEPFYLKEFFGSDLVK